MRENTVVIKWHGPLPGGDYFKNEAIYFESKW